MKLHNPKPAINFISLKDKIKYSEKFKYQKEVQLEQIRDGAGTDRGIGAQISASQNWSAGAQANTHTPTNSHKAHKQSAVVNETCVHTYAVHKIQFLLFNSIYMVPQVNRNSAASHIFLIVRSQCMFFLLRYYYLMATDCYT